MTTPLEESLVYKGSRVVNAIYGKGNLTDIKVLPLLVSENGKKKRGSKKTEKEIEVSAARQEYLAKIVAVVWYIHKKGQEQGVKGSSVSYKIVDGGQKLYQFLRKYVQVASKQSKYFAYDRSPKKNKSSHYKEESPASQFGIDIRFEAKMKSIALLPHKKKHVLFGKIVFLGEKHPELVFVKFEEYGIAAFSEKVNHGVSFFKSLTRSKKSQAKKRIEKVIIPVVAKKYLELINKASKEKIEELSLDKPRSIKTMADALKKLSKGAFKEFIKTLKSQYKHDKEYARWRSGNEVIIEFAKSKSS